MANLMYAKSPEHYEGLSPDYYFMEEAKRIQGSKVAKDGNLVDYIQGYINKREVISNIFHIAFNRLRYSVHESQI